MLRISTPRATPKLVVILFFTVFNLFVDFRLLEAAIHKWPQSVSTLHFAFIETYERKTQH